MIGEMIRSPKSRAIANLQLLHDVVARTPMNGRLWVFGGLLLGWAREGDLLGHDCDDVDFAYLAEDAAVFEGIFGTLEDAGFKLSLRYPGATGEATEYAFRRDGIKFDFFCLTATDDARFHYRSYGGLPDGRLVANLIEIPGQPLEEFRFLGRTWLKVRDHDAELTALYGDWRTPRPDWDYMAGPSIVDRIPWDSSTFRLEC